MIRKLAASVLLVFGLMTVFMSSSVILDLFGIRAKEGNYVLFVVVSNFICGFLYLISAYGMFFRKKWAIGLLLTSLGILLLSFTGLLGYISAGGLYEVKTVKAMLFRIGLTSLFTWLSWKYSSIEESKTESLQ